MQLVDHQYFPSREWPLSGSCAHIFSYQPQKYCSTIEHFLQMRNYVINKAKALSFSHKIRRRAREIIRKAVRVFS